MLSALKSLLNNSQSHFLLFDERQRPLIFSLGLALLESGYSIGALSTQTKPLLQQHLQQSALDGIYLYPFKVKEASILCFSSGTLNQQKGIVRSYKSWKNSFKLISDILTDFPNLRGTVIGSLPYSLSLFGILESLYREITPIILPNEQIKLLERRLEKQKSLLWLTPFHCTFFIKAFRELRMTPRSEVYCVFVGGAYFSNTQREVLQHVFPRAKIFSFYGTSETSFISIKPPTDTSESVGSLCPGVSIDLRNNEQQLLPKNTTGNLWVKSNQSFNSYLHTTHSISNLNGYLGINDRGFLDEAERLFFSGRKEGYISIRGHTVDIEHLEYWIKTYLGFENLSLFVLDMEASETSLV